jgi:hypothetical protein
MTKVVQNPQIHIAVYALTVIAFATAFFYPYDRTWKDGGTVYHVHTTWKVAAK